MVARLVFPSGHPAIPFLLLLAIADDALGLVILAVFYPSGPIAPFALGGLMSAALLAAFWLRRRRTQSFWPYVIGPGALSWAALYLGGFHPALALVPIVPFIPQVSSGIYPAVLVLLHQCLSVLISGFFLCGV
jgi:NhaA family Na+:H+ antiporter